VRASGGGRLLAKRKSLKGSEAEKMVNSQMPLEEKIKRADHVVWNNGDRATLMEQAKELVALWQEQSWKKS
jgi:dephospho-CoA kinase